MRGSLRASPAFKLIGWYGLEREEGKALLWTIFVILLVLWLLGMVSSYTLGGYIHILLILAIAVVLIRVIQGRRPVL
jgi:asparagine N-glycosylation enzyme membrane subunit Stt3